MALVHRVNINFNHLLNTFHPKCALNIVRFKTQQNVLKHTKLLGENKDYKTFEQMMRFRQEQASKSILVKVHSPDSIFELERFCLHYGKIMNIFSYTTASDLNFVLIEYESKEQVQNIKDAASYKFRTDCIRTFSPLFLYNFKENIYKDKRKSYKQIETFSHNSFKMIPLEKIRKRVIAHKSVSEQMVSLYESLKFTDLNIRLRFYTAEQLSCCVSRLFLNTWIVPFGSSVNGFGLTGCDLDLLCKTVNPEKQDEDVGKKFLFMSHQKHLVDRSDQKDFLETISTIMKGCIPGIHNVKNILEARVPIIKFYNLNTNMQCDLSSTNMVALHMSELLYIYGQLDWRVKPFVCTIRKWARCAGITKESPGQWITNFSLTLLIIFYLQVRNILPSLNSIKYYVELGKRNNKWSNSDLTWFTKWKESNKSNSEDDLHKLLYGFFEYYSIFDFKVQAICVREGRLKMKKDTSPLYIYNPFDATLNVSKNVTLLELSRIIDCFRNALHILLEVQEGDIVWKLLNMKKYTFTRAMYASANSSEINAEPNESDSGFNEQEFISEELITGENDTRVEETVKQSILK